MSAPHTHRAPERTPPGLSPPRGHRGASRCRHLHARTQIGRHPPHRDPALARRRTDLSQRSPGQALLVRESGANPPLTSHVKGDRAPAANLNDRALDADRCLVKVPKTAAGVRTIASQRREPNVANKSEHARPPTTGPHRHGGSRHLPRTMSASVSDSQQRASVRLGNV